MQEAIFPDRTHPTIAITPEQADRCLACGTCTGVCPASESVPGWDARKAIRALALGLEQEVVESTWPWVCTLCGRCEYNCPMGVELVKTFRACRGARARDKVPGTLHQGILMNLERGNNFGIPQDDYLMLLADLGVEMENDPEQPCPGFYVPVDKEGARLMVTINARVPYAEPDNLKFWWRIFYAAKEDWTLPAVNWDGVNWALYTGDDTSMKIGVSRIIDNARRLKVQGILYPE
ncbi:MAG: 4Fe-4S dicluster domain-containing protein [Desulfobacca sp.]|uniref:4Fe-4S dicluster domain-containing protein n=1 Tax=Desulfobacca sp. TaxID=2067990 RepID=UPI00404B522C